MNLKQLFSAENIFFFGLLLLAASLPLSPYFMSIGQFTVAFGWLLSGDFNLKFRKLYNSKAALLICGIYVLHVVGVIWSSDYDYAFTDLRIKLPLLLLPFLLVTFQQISILKYRWVLYVFVSAVFMATIISTLVLLGIIKRPISDIRDISIFISPIRFGLQICMSVFLIGYWLYKKHDQMAFWLKSALMLTCLWLACFMVILETLTGLIIFIILITAILFYHGYKQSKIITRIALILITIAIPAVVCWYIKGSFDEMQIVRSYSYTTMHTKQGNVYDEFQNLEDLENGYPVSAYVCSKELEQAWRLRSTVPFTGKDQKGQQIKYTLIRFLTSKGLKKDVEGVRELSNNEILAIEQGFTNVKFQNLANITARLHGILWEINGYMRGGDPSGHSVTQRFEYWKTAFNIFQKHPLIGVGTGDINEAFFNQYEEDGSKLDPRWRLKTHNQYLTFAVLFGAFGFIYIMIALLWPIWKDKQYQNYYYAIFFTIILLSMFTEDTLETQAGVTFFAFFNALFLFQQPENSD